VKAIHLLKLSGKHLIEPKMSEIQSVFLIFLTFFLATTQIAFFLPKLLPALFLTILDIPALPF
jgi:hypothetical protein